MTPSISLIDLILSHDGILKNLELGTALKVPIDIYEGPEIFISGTNPSDIDLLIGQDVNTINSGSFLLRRSTSTQQLLDFWRDPLLVHPTSPWHEQWSLVRKRPARRNHMLIIAMSVPIASPDATSSDHLVARWFHSAATNQ